MKTRKRSETLGGLNDGFDTTPLEYLSEENEQEFSEAPHCELNLSTEDGKEKFQEIIREGNWSNSYKQFDVTKSHLEDFVKNFKANVLRNSDNTIQFNFGHNSWGEASGWITELKIEKGQDGKFVLLGKVKWTSEAKKKIQEGAWKFVSAEISWEYKDQETEKVTKNVLTGAALTNIPFVKGMKSVEASESHQSENAHLQTKQETNIILSNTQMELSEQLAAEQQKNAQLSEELSEAKTKLAESQASEKAAKTELSEKLSAIRKEKEEGRVASLLSEAKILPAEKEETLSLLMELSEEKATKLYEMLSAASPKVNLDETGSDKGSAGKDQYSAYAQFCDQFSEKNPNATEFEKLDAFEKVDPENAGKL